MNSALQGYLAAMVESLAGAGALADAAAEMHAVAEMVDASTELTLMVDDGAVPAAARRSVLDDLLSGKVRDEVARLVHQAVTVVPASEVTTSFHLLASRLAEAADRARIDPDAPPPAEPPLGRLASRHRVGGYAAAIFESLTTSELENVEDDLFRFARTVEANRPLRSALADRELPVAEREGLAGDLLDGKVAAPTLRLVAYAIRGGRARDFVWTLDGLVEAAASARGWRVAKVRAAEPVPEEQQRELSDALATITGRPVELQVTTDPSLLAGAVVEVGDLLVDGSARHRLDELREQFATDGHAPPQRLTDTIRPEETPR